MEMLINLYEKVPAIKLFVVKETIVNAHLSRPVVGSYTRMLDSIHGSIGFMDANKNMIPSYLRCTPRMDTNMSPMVENHLTSYVNVIVGNISLP